MNCRLLSVFSLAVCGAMVSVVIARGQSLQPFTPFVADSFKCQSSSDRGATCDRTECTSAPNNYAYWKDSLTLRPISNGGRGSSWCRMSLQDMREVKVVLPSGTETTIQLPGKVCVNAHAETGSGMKNLGRTAWMQCELRGGWIQVEK